MLTQTSRSNVRKVEVLILDGGLGTTLKDRYGVTVDGRDCPLWSSHLLISDPATLSAVQTEFAKTGADIILTATYQASFEGFARTINPQDNTIGIPEPLAVSYMRSAVGIASSAFSGSKDRGTKGRVALSLGAYGAVMVPSQEYTGRYDEGHKTIEQLRDWHKERLDVYARTEAWKEVNMVAFETIPVRAEIQAVRQTMWMAHQEAADPSEIRPFWISCVFPGHDKCLPDGSSAAEVVEEMLQKGEETALPFGIGINCTKVEKVGELLQAFESTVRGMTEAGELDNAPALVIYPDGTRGEVYNTSTHEWETPHRNDDQIPWDEAMFEMVRKIKEQGFWPSAIVGGCCKTTPQDIGKLKQRIDSLAN